MIAINQQSNSPPTIYSYFQLAIFFKLLCLSAGNHPVRCQLAQWHPLDSPSHVLSSLAMSTATESNMLQTSMHCDRTMRCC